MTYDTIATFSQVTSLLFFIALFIGVLAYVFWPGNRQRFDDAQHSALGLQKTPAKSQDNQGGRS